MKELQDILNPQLITSFFLVLARISGLFIIAPLLSNQAVPARVRIALIIMLSLVIVPMAPKAAALLNLKSDLSLISNIIVELTIGLILGFVCYLVFACVQMAGELMGIQLGLAIATIFDPANEGSAGIITSFYVILGSLLFLAMDGHHLMVAGLTRSFQIIPVGLGFNITQTFGLAEMAGKAFAVAIQITIPLLVVTTVMNVVFGFITKLSPSMNIYFNTGFIIAPIVGIIMLMISIPLFRVLFAQMTEGLEPGMIRVLRDLKGI